MNDIYDSVGRIFNIQRFSVHDGPGIRTIVFFKGCSLRCRWCCNPESQSYEIQTMTEAGKAKTVGQDVRVRDIMPEILSDTAYYRRSGGGVTLSGGEILCQYKFARDLLTACKENGLNTAVESTAFATYDRIEAILPYLDLFLMDIKHMNPQKHKEYTGVDNSLILENAKKIADSKVKLITRTPVIPGFNDTKEEIEAIAKYSAKIGASEYHMLPYHRLGRDKYDGLGREYTLDGIMPPEKEKMEYLLSVAQTSGIECQIGG